MLRRREGQCVDCGNNYFTRLRVFVQNLREQQLKATVRLMCTEYKWLNTDDSKTRCQTISLGDPFLWMDVAEESVVAKCDSQGP
jgi:hypothetical protein